MEKKRNHLIHDASMEVLSELGIAFHDEELLLQMLKAKQPIAEGISRIDLSAIKEVGGGGQFLTHPTTFQHSRTEFLSLPLSNRMTYDKWSGRPNTSYSTRARDAVSKRLQKYVKPDIDSALKKDLVKFVASRKKAVRG